MLTRTCVARLRRRRDRTRSVTFAEEKEQSCSSSVLHSTTTVPTPLGGRIGGSDPISARTGESLALTSTYRLLCSAYTCTSSLKRLAGWAPAQKARQPWREQSGDAGAERFLSSRQECLVCYAGPAGGQIADEGGLVRLYTRATRTTGGDSRNRLRARGGNSPGRVRPRGGDSRGEGRRLGAARRPGRVPLGGASGSSPVPRAPPLPCGPFLDWGGHHGTTLSCARRWGWTMWGLSRSRG